MFVQCLARQNFPANEVCCEFKQPMFPKHLRRSFTMKSMFLKAAKVVALSLVLTLGASGVVFANGGGVSPTAAHVGNGGGNGAGSKTGKRRHHRVTRRHRKG